MTASSLANSGARRLSPSCSSASVSSEESGDEVLDDMVSVRNASEADSNFYESMRLPSGDQIGPATSSRVLNNIAQRKKLATPSPIKSKTASDSTMNETFYSSLSSPMYSTIGSPHHDKSQSSIPDLSESYQRQQGLDYHSAKMAASEIARSGGPGHPNRPNKEDRHRSRTDLKKRLKQLALTSETGSASVIEVIEPNSSEEEEFMKSMQEMNWSKAEPQTPLTRSKRVTTEAYPSPAPSSRTSKTSDSSGSGRMSRLNQSNRSIAVSHDSSSTNQNMGYVSKNLLRSEPDILAGVRNVGQDIADSIDNIDTDDDLHLSSYDLDAELLTDSSLQKKKGFLQKLSIFQKKKPGKSVSRSKDIAPEYFHQPDTSIVSANQMLSSLNISQNDQLGMGNMVDERSERSRNTADTLSGVTRISVGESKENSKDRLSKSLSPATRKAANAGKVKDGMNVGNSDDSGIIARPTSSASKSDASVSRPDSSSSDQPTRKDFNQDRISPIGSEQVKQSTNQNTTIITVKSNNVNNNTARTVRKSSTVKKGRKGEEKPWYDVSDEDVDIQTPDHITSIISVRGSSDEDPF